MRQDVVSADEIGKLLQVVLRLFEARFPERHVEQRASVTSGRRTAGHARTSFSCDV